MKVLSVIYAAVLACATTASPSSERIEIRVSEPVIIASNETQAVFDDAIAWSREHQLETGGCFTVFKVIGNKVFITDAVERVIWRRGAWVQLDCADTAAIWHTHWQEETSATVGCNVARAQDIVSISPDAALGLVICGAGRDSVIPYTHSVAEAKEQREYLEKNPDVAERMRLAHEEANRYTCAQESPESMVRPMINCRKP